MRSRGVKTLIALLLAIMLLTQAGLCLSEQVVSVDATNYVQGLPNFDLFAKTSDPIFGMNLQTARQVEGYYVLELPQAN